MSQDFNDTIPGTSVSRGLGRDDLIVIAGAGGFIAGSLTRYFAEQGYTNIRAIDRKPLPDWYLRVPGVESISMDLSHEQNAIDAVKGAVEVYNLAADMGGMGFIENNRALCAEDVQTTLTMIQTAHQEGVDRFFYASSACVYPAEAQRTPEVTPLAEHMAIPAEPEAGYGWAKLYGELLARYFWEDYGLETRIGRFHNIYGTHTAWTGGREKAPAAICRKVASVALGDDDMVMVWGDGKQTRSFCWVDDCVEGILRLMESDVREPINIGSDELVTIDGLVDMVAEIAGVDPPAVHDLAAPQGVRGRNSDNTLIKKRLGWAPDTPLRTGMAQLYDWVSDQMGAR
jgi:GDP-D-mannose 3', 5'-epimerase